MKNISYIVLLIISFSSCKKDDPIDPSNSPICINFDIGPDECPWGGPSYKVGSPNYQMPCFNPNNPDEFIYRHGNAIWKYTISSQQSTLIRNEVRPFTQLDWGSSGWITFTAKDWKVWILSEDGGSLRPISDGYRDFGPEFNHDGQKIVYGHSEDYSNYDLDNNPDLRLKYKMFIVDIIGIPIDSFCRVVSNDQCYPWDFCSWSSDDLKFAVPENGVRIYDKDGNPLSGRLKDHDVIIHHDIEWHPAENIVFFTDEKGLKRLDVSNEMFNTIKESCDSKKYMDISISNDGKTILASREISTYSDCTVTSRMDLVLMDIDGNDEQVVQIE